jgi:hypothetical protein
MRALCNERLRRCLARLGCDRAAVLALLLMTALGAQAKDFSYYFTNGTITITSYNGPGGDVTVPSTINGVPVTTI